jgi:hypothetical protein
LQLLPHLRLLVVQVLDHFVSRRSLMVTAF